MDSTGNDEQASDESVTEDPYTPQSDGLRRQQFLFAVVGSLLGGAALAVSLIQRYPDYQLLWILAGGLASILLFRLVSRSVFPGGADADNSEEDEDSETDPSNDSPNGSPDSGTSAE